MSRAFEPGRLSPLGTARQRVDAGDPARAARAAYPFDLLPELRDADLGPESLFLAWELAALNAALSPAEQRELTAIFARALIDVAGGSTRTPVAAGPTRALLARATEAVGGPGDRRPFILDGGFLYQQRLLACEDRLAAALRGRRAGSPLAVAPAVDEALAAVAATTRPALTDEQATAVRAALVGRLTVISGGPGTGKTTIVLAIVRALALLGVPARAVALAAPTGKAANRLEQAIQHGLEREQRATGAAAAADSSDGADSAPAAETLHRLLGWSPRQGSFAHHQNNRLAQRAVIVDESSMIDLALMERLARAVADDARLILLGDADQLPSIEAGAVFRDLTPAAHRLTRSHRVDAGAPAGQQLADFARRIRDGVTQAELAARAPAEIAFRGVEMVAPAAREALLEVWYRHALVFEGTRAAAVGHVYRAQPDGQLTADDQARLEELHRDLHSARVLCVTRARPTGTAAVNAWMHRRRSEDGVRGNVSGAEGAFLPGEPVMVLRNDYQRGLFNGDQGVVILYDEGDDRPPRLAAAFPTRQGWQAFPIDGVGDGLELSFAMTVHKAQGSELDTALLLLPDVPIPILTRELLYTAVTRVRHGVVICGAPAVLTAGAAAPLVRSSGLADKLAD